MVSKTLEETKKQVWPRIQKYLKDPSYPQQFQLPKKFKKEADLFWEINKVYPERQGKYLRPTLVILTSHAMGVKNENVLKVAAAMQLSEEWLLIHDDIEDKSKTRRGGKTLHSIYGNELAINAGDALHMTMWKMVNDINSKKISNEFYTMLFRTAQGQAIEQIWANAHKKIIQKDEYFLIADSKSAYYSVAGPMRLGAMLAGASNGQLNKITKFGLHLGRCFQLVDDILDIKQDKLEGKNTLAITKGIDYAKALANKEKDKALLLFNSNLSFLSNEPARQKLKELINFILERSY